MATQEIGIEIPVNEIETFCKQWDVAEMSLFGSALRKDFSCDSDVDVLVTFSDDARHGLFDMVRMRDRLQDLFGRQVDLVSRRAVERSRNKIRRDAILRSARVIYAAG